MIGRTNVSGGGLNINGIIEQYEVVSGGNVSAGDFVEFIENLGDSSSYAIYSQPKGIKISEDTVALFYYASSNIKGRIINISGDTLSVKSEVILTTESGVQDIFDVDLLNNSNMVVVYSTSSKNQLNFLIVNASNDTLSKISNYSNFYYSSTAGYQLGVTCLDTDVFCITHYSNSYTNSIVIKINNLSTNDYTIGTDTQIMYGYTTKRLYSKKIDNNNFLIFVYSKLVKINVSDLSVSKVVDSSTNMDENSTFEEVDTNKYILVGKNYLTTSFYNLVAEIVELSDNIFTYGNITNIDYLGNNRSYVGACKTKKNHITISYTNQMFPNVIDIRVSGNKIYKLTNPTRLGTENLTSNCFNVAASRILTFITSNSNSYPNIYSSRMLTQKSENSIGGLAKSSSTSGNNVEVYIPDYTS